MRTVEDFLKLAREDLSNRDRDGYDFDAGRLRLENGVIAILNANLEEINNLDFLDLVELVKAVSHVDFEENRKNKNISDEDQKYNADKKQYEEGQQNLLALIKSCSDVIYKKLAESGKPHLEQILKLTRTQQKAELGTMTLDNLRALACALAQSDTNQDTSTFKTFSSLATKHHLLAGISKLLKQFPEVQDERLAIDRGVDYFGNKNSFVEAIAKDINDRRMSRIRYHELLHINFFKEYKEGASSAGMLSGTLLAFILPKLVHPIVPLHRIKEYNPKLFANYTKTANQYLTATNILETKPLFELYDLYRKELGFNEENWRDISEYIAPAGRRGARANNEEMRVDTHNIASHKSADESHVKAFEIFTKAVAPEAQLTFFEQDTTTGLYRKITVQKNDQLNNAVSAENKKLKSVLDRLLIKDAGRNARIYNEFFKYTLTKDYIAKDYKDLSAEEKQTVDQKINGFIFKAGAAKRYVDDMLTKHRIDGGYAYNTTDAATCGLDMEQMLAACYFATTDVVNFRAQENKDEPNHFEHQKKAAFVALVNQLHDMRRGYDIDDGTDNINENIFPTNPTTDHNRCHGGAVNSLMMELQTVHTAYNIRSVTPALIEKDITDYYSTINVLEIVNAMEQKPSPQAFALWTETNIAPTSVRNALKTKFENEYENVFDKTFKGYVTDSAFANIKQNALNNIKIPKDLKDSGLNYHSELSTQEVCDAIINGTLPFLRFDPEEGYQTRLNYYLQSNKKFEEGLVLYFNTLDKNLDANQQALLFLANSNLPEDVAKQIVIKTIDDVQFTLNDIKGLGENEFAALISYNNKKDLLDWCADNLHRTFNLFDLTLSKLVHNTLNELSVYYGSSGITILHIAASLGNTAFISKILKDEQGREALSIGGKCNKGATPLHYAMTYNNTAAIAEILKHPEGRKCCFIANNRGETPLHLAAEKENLAAIAEILKHPEGKLTLAIQDNFNDTPLHLAAGRGDVYAIAEILKHKEGRLTLSIQDTHGKTPLHLVAERRNLAAIAEILKHPEGRKCCFIANNSGETLYNKLSDLQKFEMVKQIGDNFAIELEDQDKNRLMHSIVSHLSAYGPKYTAISMFNNLSNKVIAINTQVDISGNQAEIQYLKEHERLLAQVIKDLNPQTYNKRQRD